MGYLELPNLKWSLGSIFSTGIDLTRRAGEDTDSWTLLNGFSAVVCRSTRATAVIHCK